MHEMHGNLKIIWKVCLNKIEGYFFNKKKVHYSVRSVRSVHSMFC
jgi:hypothetical protein